MYKAQSTCRKKCSIHYETDTVSIKLIEDNNWLHRVIAFTIYWITVIAVEHKSSSVVSWENDWFAFP